MLKKFSFLMLLTGLIIIVAIAGGYNSLSGSEDLDLNGLLIVPAHAGSMEFDLPGFMEKKKDKPKYDSSIKSGSADDEDMDEEIDSDCCKRLARIIRNQQEEFNELKRNFREFRENAKACCNELKAENVDLRNALRRLESKISDIESRCCD